MLMRMTLSVFMLSGVLGCTPTEKSSGRITAADSLTRPSSNGSKMYALAKERYGKVRLLDDRGAALTKSMNEVLTLMDSAQANDTACPLFHAKAGEICIELGPDGMDRAGIELQNALTTCPEWIPAHVALADLACRRGRLVDAAQHLKNAEAYLDAIQKSVNGSPKNKTQPALGPFAIFGLGAGPVEGQHDNPNDPRLPDQERMRLLLTWLQDSEQWTIENPALVTVVGAQTTLTGAGQEGLFRRLHARIEFQRVLLDRRANRLAPKAVAAKLDGVLQWDPDYFPARFEKAEQFRLADECRAAERLLVPYVESVNPMLKNNANLMYELARVYARWFTLDGGAEMADHADQYFHRLHDLNPRHSEGWHDRACFYAEGCAKLARPELVKVAQQCLDSAVECGYGDKQEIAHVQKLIDDAAKPRPAAPAAGAPK